MNTHEAWAPGVPVLLTTEHRQHFAYVKVTGACFRPRWLRTTFANGRRLICPSELTPRDPRELWSDPWELQLGLALLCAVTSDRDDRFAWLCDIDEATEPELFDLRELALQELQAVPPTPTTGPAPTPAPAPARKAWTKAERDAMRAASAAPPEYVDLAPGR